jgi:hypothetical protein
MSASSISGWGSMTTRRTGLGSIAASAGSESMAGCGVAAATGERRSVSAVTIPAATHAAPMTKAR